MRLLASRDSKATNTGGAGYTAVHPGRLLETWFGAQHDASPSRELQGPDEDQALCSELKLSMAQHKLTLTLDSKNISDWDFELEAVLQRAEAREFVTETEAECL